MRTIKFRGKTFENPEWAYGDLLNFGNNVLSIGSYAPIGYELKRRVDPETVGQFTGLYDKNGKEIYEGDIIRHKDMVKAYYVVYDGHEFCPNDGFRSLSYPKHWEVIGNIHDNPELLGEKGGEQ